MTAELLPLVFTSGWASGVNSYATVLLLGLLGRFAGMDAVPAGLERTDVLVAGVDFGLPQWSSGQAPPTFAEDFQAIAAGVILMPLVIPWGYVYRHYIKQPSDRWR